MNTSPGQLHHEIEQRKHTERMLLDALEYSPGLADTADIDNKEFTIIMIDVDAFKRLHDEHGTGG